MHNLFKAILLGATILAAVIGPASATNYYINNANGSDSNDGKTLGSAFATLQKGANVAVAGDTVYVLPGLGYGGGTSGTAPLTLVNSGTGGGTTNATCTSPITFTGYFGPYNSPNAAYPRPVINGSRANGIISGAYPMSCIVINGFELAGWAPSLTWAQVSANAGATGTGWQTVAYNGDGIFIGGGTSSHIVHHLTVTNNYIHDVPLGGIALNYGDYMTVSNNIVFNTSNDGPYAGSGISLYEPHNIDAGIGTKNIVSGNLTYNNINYVMNRANAGVSLTTSAATAAGGTTLTFASSAITSGVNYTMAVVDVTNGSIPPGSVVYSFSGTNNVTVNLSGGTITSPGVGSGDTIYFGYITDGEGIIIDNTSNSQSDSVPYVGRSLVTNNLVFGNGGPGIACGPTSSNCDITFNTLYSNQVGPGFVGNGSTPGEINMNAATTSNLYNNILFASTGQPAALTNAGTGTTWSNNLFYNYTGGTQPGTNNVLTNPLFVNPSTNPATANFQLQSGSPAIEAGSSTFTRATDYMGHPGLAGLTYDMGAYEQPTCAGFGGAGTVQTEANLLTALKATGAGVINEQLLRNMVVTLACGTTASWGH